MIIECPGCQSRYDVSGRPPGTRARCRCGTVFMLPEPAQSAGMLSCPNCGAPAAPGAHGCQFCNAKLLVRACPRCFARIFHGHHHCPHCGVAVLLPARAAPGGEAEVRRCPACPSKPELVARLIGDVLIDECGQCHGLWLDAAAVERVVRERGVTEALPLGELGRAKAQFDDQVATPAPPQPRAMYIRCPDCSAVMNRVNFGRISGIIVDVCRGHGTWFDCDELNQVIAFVLEGGLEKAHRREVEALQRKAREARAEAAAAKSTGAMFSAPARRTHEPGAELLSAALSFIARVLR